MTPQNRTNAPLGRTQRLILHVLAAEAPRTPADISRASAPLYATDSAVRNALDRLWARGLVERRTQTGTPAFLWYLTPKGHEVEQALP